MERNARCQIFSPGNEPDALIEEICNLQSIESKSKI